ncbi:MAG: EAL domain-containing protein [Rhodoferax sp.]|nr:EAL domain-containing protein [Rhodoferax sp.]
MTEPAQRQQSLDGLEQALRARRLVQIATVTITGLVIVLVRSLLEPSPTTATAILTLAIATMLLCVYLNHRGSTNAANLLLLVALTTMAAALLWRGEGLRDSAMLTLPALLIVGALLVSPRHFVLLAVTMLLLGTGIAVATHFGLRQDAAPDRLLNRALDTTVILAISAFAVWAMIGDLHRHLTRLGVQLTRLRQSQESLTYLSQHDVLTQLPNRILGRSRIEQGLAHAQRNRRQIAVLFVDLDNFKSINDAFGHTVGDEFLREAARRLQSSVRQSDVVSRQGGDEFLIGLTDLAQGEHVGTVAAKILARMAETYKVGEAEIASSCSIGIATYPSDGPDFETLLRNADISAGYAKDAGRNLFRFYEESMNTRLQENLLLVAGLRNALARDEFVLHYQPVVDIRSGRMVAAEALVRWNSPELGLVAPGLFIGAAERSGLIVDIGRWVLQEACRQMAAWRRDGHPAFVLAVNLSPVEFHRGNIESAIASILQSSEIDPAYLELELTESTLIQDSEKFMLSLKKLKALGVRIAIDDFGTGYSNLSYLQRFSVDKIKIDQSFVRELLAGPQQQAIVSAIIQIAASLKLTTTAEGIETEEIRQRLAELGCELGQGYLFARPMPAQAFMAWRAQNSADSNPLPVAKPVASAIIRQ